MWFARCLPCRRTTMESPQAPVGVSGSTTPLAQARGLVLMVAVHAESSQRSGLRFVTDVLHANGLATLDVSLHTADERARGIAPPGLVAAKHRLRAIFQWLSVHPALAGLPIALVGIDGAVRSCIAAAARYRLPSLRSLVLLEGQPFQAAQLMARLSQPTLLVIGACDARTLGKHRAALRQMSAPSRLDMLPLRTRPTPAAGVHQVFAHATLQWIAQTLPREGDATPRPAASPCRALPDPRHDAAGIGA